MPRAKKAPTKDKAKPRKRAHEDDGTFKSDDPATPDVNEAFEGPAGVSTPPLAALEMLEQMSHKSVNVQQAIKSLKKAI